MEKLQLSIVITTHGRGKFTNGWKELREVGQILLMICALGTHEL
jgi:hypothetical protein